MIKSLLPAYSTSWTSSTCMTKTGLSDVGDLLRSGNRRRPETRSLHFTTLDWFISRIKLFSTINNPSKWYRLWLWRLVLKLNNHQVPRVFLNLFYWEYEPKSEHHKDPFASLKGRRKVLNRVYFPETWIWHCFTLKSKREHFELQTPHTITKWSGQVRVSVILVSFLFRENWKTQTKAIGLSRNKGFGISRKAFFRTEKLLFVDFLFPSKSVRNEVSFIFTCLVSYNVLRK